MYRKKVFGIVHFTDEIQFVINGLADLFGDVITKNLAGSFPGKVFKTTIPRNIRLAEAPSHGLPVGAYDRFSKGARAYKAVTKELVQRVG